MEQTFEKTIELISSTIKSIRISEESKRNLLEVLKGIVASPNNRVYVKSEDDYEEYITLRPCNYTPGEELEPCIIKRYIEPSGATANRLPKFVSLQELSKYVDEHLTEIKLSLYGINVRHSKTPHPSPINKKEEHLKLLRTKINNMSTTPENKNRLWMILDKLAGDQDNKVYLEQSFEFEMYVMLLDERLVLRTVQYDPSGTKVGSTNSIITSKKLCELALKYKDKIDQELLKGKKF